MPAKIDRPKFTNLTWPNDRPRWTVQPALRKAGWQSGMLLDASGLPLDEGAAIARTREINEAVAAWRRGERVAPEFADYYPPAGAGAEAPAPAAGPRSIGWLIDAFLADPMPARKPLKPRTLRNYRSNLKLLVATIARLQGISPAEVRSLDITFLQAPPPKSGLPFHVSKAHDAIYSTLGVHSAAACITVASCFFQWVIRKHSLLEESPTTRVHRQSPPGRIVVWAPHETDAMVRAADWIGCPEIGDAIVLGLDLSWPRQDLLAMRWAQIDAKHRVWTRRIKTGVQGMPRLQRAGRERIEQIRERWAGRNLPEYVIADAHHRPYKEEWFRLHFALVREIAHAELVGLGFACDPSERSTLDKTFADIRDTAITNFVKANMSYALIATRSLHSQKNAPRILAKYYAFVTGNAEASAAADDLLETYWDKQDRDGDIDQQRHAA